MKFQHQREPGQVCNVNMEVDEETNELVIRIDLNKHYGKSSTGKSYIIACSSGPKPLAGRKGVSVGVNVFAKAQMVEDKEDEEGDES